MMETCLECLDLTQGACKEEKQEYHFALILLPLPPPPPPPPLLRPSKRTPRFNTPLSGLRTEHSCSQLFALSKLVSLFRLSVDVTAGLPLFMRPLISCQSTSLDASSAGCLKQWPASFNLPKPTFADTCGKLPYLR